MKVFVYFNLHKKLFSVKALEGPNKGRVVAHNEEILLHNVSFKVSEAGRQRVLKEKKKNVHAGAVGYWHPLTYTKRALDTIMSIGTPVTYNPYKYDGFVKLIGEDKVSIARSAALFVRNNKGYIVAEYPN
jgi:hypothetical protein